MIRRPSVPSKDQRGIALLLSLLLMAALTAAGVGASTVIINEFRTTASTDAGIGAYYAANVGIERSLFVIFNGRLNGTSLGDESAFPGSSSVFAHVRDNAPAMSPLYGGASVSMAETTISQTTKTVNLRKEQSLQLDLFNQSNPFNPGSTVGVARKIYIRSPNLMTFCQPIAPGKPCPWVEIQWNYVKKTASNANPLPNATIRLVATENVNDDGSTCRGVTIDLLDGNVSPTDGSCSLRIVNPAGITTSETTPGENEIAGWNVRIKALYADIPNLTVAATKTDNSAYRIPGDFNIVSRGQSNNARARLDANVPWRLPTSGLFDYVIFSEGQLDKPGS